MGLGGQHEVRQQQPRALLDDTGLQSRPTTDGAIEIPTKAGSPVVPAVVSGAFGVWGVRGMWGGVVGWVGGWGGMGVEQSGRSGTR
jgi:hypothetical protein